MPTKINRPVFTIKKAKNGDFYFDLTDKNGQRIAVSDHYISKDGVECGIRSFKDNAPIAEIDDQTEEA